jgi:DNA-binding MarR family transcriptional regulator
MRATQKDICANRHGGNPQSAEASRRTNRLKDRALILDAFRQIGPRGAICEEIEDYLGMKHATASARISELTREGLLREKPLRGDNSGKCERRLTKSHCFAAVRVLAAGY